MWMILVKLKKRIFLSITLIVIFFFVAVEINRRFQNRSKKDVSEFSNIYGIFIKTPSRRSEIPDGLLPKLLRSGDTVETSVENIPQCLEKPYLLILVTSAPDHFQKRDAIRKSWANIKRWVFQVPGVEAKTVFLVGKSSLKILEILVKCEKRHFGDIIEGEYVDSYRNLTLKVMHGFSWAAKNCLPSFLLKTDDDCFINVPQLLYFLRKFNNNTDSIYAGRIRRHRPVIRDPKSPWFVTSLEYPNSTYAPYALGPGYLLSQNLIQMLLDFSSKVDIFPVEDAYVGTVLNLAGVTPTDSKRFFIYFDLWKGCESLYYFMIHSITDTSNQIKLQDMANNSSVLCSMDNMNKTW